MNATQVVTAVIGALGGLGGIGALVGSVLQSKRIRAETADVLTNTALTLVEPLRARVRELDEEARAARAELRSAREEARELFALLRRWRAAILDHSRTRADLDRMVIEYHDSSDRK